jgi:hypothetical protein
MGLHRLLLHITGIRYVPRAIGSNALESLANTLCRHRVKAHGNSGNEYTAWRFEIQVSYTLLGHGVIMRELTESMTLIGRFGVEVLV